MITQLFESYMAGKNRLVWKNIALVEYPTLTDEEKKIIHQIITEVLQRIDFNIKLIKSVHEENGFEFLDYGNINSYQNQYLLKDPNHLFENVEHFYENRNSNAYLPFFFACFCNYFEIIDFRGKFPFSNDILLDPLFIDSFHTQNEAEELIFRFPLQDGEMVDSCMFSPDQFVKDDESGDIGPCIVMDQKLLIDNLVVNFHDKANLYFLDYLRFCFEWICFPNLYWADESEQAPFKNMIEKVRMRLKPF